jgi:hypothetical protein
MLGESEASSLGSITITVCRKKYQLSVAKGVTIQTPSLHDSLSEKEKKAALSLITQSVRAYLQALRLLHLTTILLDWVLRSLRSARKKNTTIVATRQY